MIAWPLYIKRTVVIHYHIQMQSLFQGFLVACIYCYMNSEVLINHLSTHKCYSPLHMGYMIMINKTRSFFQVQTAVKRSYTRLRQSLAEINSNRRMLSSRTQSSFSTNVSSLVENQQNHAKTSLMKNGKRGELEMTVIPEENYISP